MKSTEITYEVILWETTLSPHARAAWRELLAAQPSAPVFLHPEWFDEACHVGAVRPWQVVVIRRQRRPIAVIPLRKRTPWTAEVVTMLSPDCPPLLIDPSAEAAVWTGFAAWLRSSAGIGVVSLGRHRDTPQVRRLQQMATDHGFPFFRRPAGAAMWAPLPTGWDAYLASLSRSMRTKMRTAEQRLQRDVPDAVVEVLSSPSACLAAVDDLIRLSCHQWENRVEGSLLQHQRVAEFYRRIVHWEVTRGWAVMPVLRVNARTVVVATLFHIPGQEAAYYHLIGRDPDVLPSRYSPGIVLLGTLIRAAIARGARRLNLGQGAHPYKITLGGTPSPQWECFVARSAIDAAVLPTLDPALQHLRGLPTYVRHLCRRTHAQPA